MDAPDDQIPRRRLLPWIVPIAVGMIYGLTIRLFVDVGARWTENLFGVMTLTYLFVVPLVTGVLTVGLVKDREPSWGEALVAPWVSTLLVIAGAVLLVWEGLICAIIWAPIALVCASVGGGIAKVWRRAGRARPLALASVAVLPVVLAPIESRLPEPTQTRTVADQIVIAADAATVWEQIRAVPPIRPDELDPSFAYRIGFPRPVEARLDGQGVGSVRHATFEGGVTFIERVTEWEDGRSLAFTIDASAVPSTTFDQHVAVGGPYFDVLTGRYVIEEVGPDRVVLHLSSEQRLSTRFNAYTQLWTDLFMSDVQETILRVIRDRAERAA